MLRLICPSNEMTFCWRASGGPLSLLGIDFLRKIGMDPSVERHDDFIKVKIF